MKVLMLGWEFPPHISGGLGTACFGLTQGLSTHGVEVLFVVPRAHGDEDQRYVRVLGANQVELADGVLGARKRRVSRSRAILDGQEASSDGKESSGGAAKTSEPRGARSRRAAERELSAWERVGKSLEILAVDSALTPYLNEKSYIERLTRLRERGLAAAEVRAEARAAVDELKRVLLGHGRLEERAGEIAETIARRGKLEFSGVYGPDLMAEVARFALATAEIARSRGFDVIHAHDWMTVPAGLVAARVARKPLVVHVHACEYDRSGENVNTAVRDIEQLGLDGSDLVVCVSHYTANLLQQKYRVDPRKLRVVHNAVTHKQQIEHLHEQKHIEEPIVLFLGRVTFQKGPDYFLEAAARVIKLDPRVKFVMSGSGDMLPVMIERCAKLGLARHMHFTGFLKGSDVERMYAMADIYVMPSVSEPFGISPLEAMALDTPVVLSRQSGVSEVLRNALKVDFWDVQDMANKILALLKYPALRDQLMEEGREEIGRIRWEYPAGLVRDVYQELVA
jgi:glycosyltransferase involved in cell wall biosynthesis